MDNNKEVTVFQLFKIIYEGRIIILSLTLISFIISLIFIINHNNTRENLSEVTLDGLIPNSSALINFDFVKKEILINSETIGSKRQDQLKILNLTTGSFRNIFIEHLKDKENIKKTANEVDVHLNDINFKVNVPPKGSIFKIQVTSLKENINEIFLNKIIENSISMSQKTIIDYFKNDYEYLINSIKIINEIFVDDSVKIEKLISEYPENFINEDITNNKNKLNNLQKRLNELKLHNEIAIHLGIPVPLYEGDKIVIIESLNAEYLRGYNSLSVEIKLIEKILKDSGVSLKNPEYFPRVDFRKNEKYKNNLNKINYLNQSRDEHINKLKQFTPILYNNMEIINSKIGLLNPILYLLFSVIFSISLGIVIVLFRYSIKTN